jgi:phosphoribosyl 1,2-cyclic phosphodiesterase
MMISLTFLGTGGGRFATIYQIRSTGNIYLHDGANVHIDPGPGALANMRRLSMDPAKTDAILVSHCHPDHYVNAEVLIEGMVMGGFKRRGILVGSRTVIEGSEDLGPSISSYHRSLPEKTIIAEPGDELEVGQVGISVTPTIHNDPLGVGFRFHTTGGEISYVSDTEIAKEVVDAHRGTRVLILNLTRPLRSKVPRHLSTEEAIQMVELIGPEFAILTHFGMKIIHEGVDIQSSLIEKETGVRTIAANDLMSVGIGRTVRVTRRGLNPPRSGERN